MLMQLGEALGVQDLSELTGEETLKIGLQRRGTHDVVPAIREAIESAELAVPTCIRPNAQFLEEKAERAWQVWHTSATPRADAGAMLPAIIRDGRRAVRVLEGEDRRTAYRALAGPYARTRRGSWLGDSGSPSKARQHGYETYPLTGYVHSSCNQLITPSLRPDGERGGVHGRVGARRLFKQWSGNCDRIGA
jgi:hypothetical protein